jgi:hypothetical protein
MVNINQGTPGAMGINNMKQGWQANIDGAIGELATALMLDEKWNDEMDGDRKAPDVGIYQVRTNKWNKNAHLYNKENDKPTDIFILCVGWGFKYRLAGWMYGHEVQQKKYFSDKWGKGDSRSAYWVPEKDIHSITTLPKEIINGQESN